MLQQMNSLAEVINRQQEIVTKNTILLERISKKIIPDHRDLNIFPIKSCDHLEQIEKDIQNIDKSELISYIREKIGKASLSKCFSIFFSDSIIVSINWDGIKKKTAIKQFKLFNSFIFEAVKSESFGYVQYEEEMRRGFRLAKNRFYKITYNLKRK